jgi:hypothetical protein
MKKERKIVLLAALLICWGYAKAQTTNPPPVLHREITWAAEAPSGPAVFENTNTTTFVGEGNPTSQIQSGEDWWYDTKPIYENGTHTGYIVVGFTTYRNMYFSEHLLNPPGFLNVLNPSPAFGQSSGDECARLLNKGETISQYRQVISRFDLKGRMIWCKPLNYGHALNSVCQGPDGSIYAIGETESAYKYGNFPEPYIYNPTLGASNQPLVSKVNSPSLTNLNDYSNYRVLIYKFDTDGNTIWSYQYGYEDILDLTGVNDQLVKDANSQKLKDQRFFGVDISPTSDGSKLIALGQTLDDRVITFSIDYNGHLLVKKIYDNTEKFVPKALSCVNGNCFIVGGTDNSSGPLRKAYIYNIDENTLNKETTGNWAVNPKYYALSNSYGSMFTDVEIDNNDDIVTTGLEIIIGGALTSLDGGNGGNGLLCRISNTGNLQTNNTIGQFFAYDLRVGLTKTSTNGFAVVSSVQQKQFNYDNSPYLEMRQARSNAIYPSNCAGLSGAIDVGATWETNTFVGKYDQNLNLIWSNTFDADDKNPLPVPGDIKKQECMYRIAEATDGKLFVVGNSSHNIDDYYAALIESDCQINVSYDLPGIAVPQPLETVIQPTTSAPYTQTWNTPKVIKGIIRVKANATLRIENTTIEIANSQTVGMDTRFIVEKGGRLEIINSTLTCVQSCGKQYWQGIELLGESFLDQTLQGQASLYINGSTIEYAKEAIIPGDYHDWSKNGGIIEALNSNFINNNRSVQYLPYQNRVGTSNPELNNIGKFTNCTFTWTDDFLGYAPQPAITMFGTKGVQISGCTFNDERLASIPLTDRARGIFTIDAGYFVKGKPNGVGAPQHDYFNTSQYDVGEFINMYKAIENLNGGSLKPFVVDHNRFLNCHYGVIVSGTDNAMITRNEFNFTNSVPFLLEYGIRREVYLTNATSYKIEGNHFYNDLNGFPMSEFVVGCNINNSGIEENLVRRNKFKDLTLGNAAQRANRSTSIFQVKGLQFTCNTNSTNLYDMSNVSIGQTDGIRLDQGALNQATQNSVSQNLTSSVNFRTNDILSLKYYYNAPSDEPTYTGLVNTNPGSLNECLSVFGNIVIADPDLVVMVGKRDELADELDILQTEMEQIEQTYVANLESGDSPYLHDVVTTMNQSSSSSVRSSLQSFSPYLSISLLTELGEVPTNIFSEAWYISLLSDNIEVMEDAAFRNFLRSKTEPLSDGEIEVLLALSNSSSLDRGTKRSEIASYTSQIEDINNLLLLDYLASDAITDQEEIAEKIANRGHYAQRAEKVDYWMGREEYVLAHNELEALTTDLNSMPYADINLELLDFVSFKTYVLEKLTLNPNFYSAMTTVEEAELISMRDSYSGKAAIQAGNLLCFHKGICSEYDFLQINSSKTQVFMSQTNKDDVPVHIESYEVYPNPSNGEFIVRASGEAEIMLIEVYDLMGKKINFETTSKSKGIMSIHLSECEKGIYLLHIDSETGNSQTMRIIKN